MQKQIDDLKKMISGFASKINQMKSQQTIGTDNFQANTAPVPSFDFEVNAELENRILECENQIHKLQENKIEEETFDIRAFAIEERITKLEKEAALKMKRQMTKKDTMKIGVNQSTID